MKYYKKSFKSNTEYLASTMSFPEMISDILLITVFQETRRYWIERTCVFTWDGYESIDKLEFEKQYQKAIESFNPFLKQ
jgi:hypothetical protein